MSVDPAVSDAKPAKLSRPAFRALLRATWDTVRNHGLKIAALTLIVQTPIDLLMSFVPGGSEGSSFTDTMGRWRLEGTLQAWIGVIGSMALIHLVAAGSAPITIREAFRRSLRCYWRGVWATLSFDFAVGFLLILLVVPGLIAISSWAFYLPYVTLESKSGWGALSASSRLTAGRSWVVFWQLAACWSIAFGATIVLGVAATSLPESRALKVLANVPADLTFAIATIFTTHLFLMLQRLGPRAAEPKSIPIVI